MALSFLEPFGYSHGWRDIVNNVSFDVDERSPAADWTTVWDSNDTINLTIGETAQIDAKASDPFRDALDLELGTDVIISGAGTVAVALSRHSGQSTTISITAIGGSVTVTHLQFRARTVPTARTVKVAASDAVSIGRHGQRSYPDDVPWVSAHDAYAITQVLLAHYAQRRPTVQMRLVSSDTDHLLQILTRTISDLITIRHGELGMDADFHIESLQHTLTRMPASGDEEENCAARVHYATLGCERSGATSATNPFTFDVAGKGFDDGVFDPSAADNPDTVFIFDDPTRGRFDFGAFGT